MPKKWRPRASYIDVDPQTTKTFDKYLPDGERMRILGAVMSAFAKNLQASDNPSRLVTNALLQSIKYKDIDAVLITKLQADRIKKFINKLPEDKEMAVYAMQLFIKEVLP